MSARRALVPESPCPRAVMHLARRQRSLQRVAIRVRHHQHHARDGVLRDDGQESATLLEIESVQIERSRVVTSLVLARIHRIAPRSILMVFVADLATRTTK